MKPEGNSNDTRTTNSVEGLVQVRNERSEQVLGLDTTVRAMLDAVPFVAFIKDADGCYLYVNIAAEQLLGKPAHEVVGRTDEQVFSEKAARQNRRNDAHVLLTKDVMQSVETIVSRDGTSRDYSCFKFSFTAPNGREVIGGAVIDITEQRRAHRAVTASQQRLKAALEAGYDAFFALEAARDAEGKINDFVFVDLNRNGEKLLNLARWQVIGQRLCDLLPIYRAEGFLPKYIRVVESRSALEEEFPMPSSSGKTQWLRHQVVPLGDGIAITTREVTEQKLAEATLREHTRVLENALGGIAFVSDQGWFTYANAEFCRMLGVTLEDLLGLSWEVAIADEDVPVVAEAMNNASPDARTDIQCRGKRPDGEPLFMRCLLISVVSGDGAFGRYFFAEDITEKWRYEAMLEEQNRQLTAARADLQAANARLQQLATTDGLTGLSNRREFQDQLSKEFAEAIRYEQPLSMIMMDVDRFKQYNDTYGHPAGDDVLRQVARVLREEARAVDVVARYGGEEFAILLPGTDIHGAIALGERCRVTIEGSEWPNRQVTASFGCAERSELMPTPEDLVKLADQALYISKESGRNRVTPQELGKV